MNNETQKAAFSICQRAYENTEPPDDDDECREFSEEMELERRIEAMEDKY